MAIEALNSNLDAQTLHSVLSQPEFRKKVLVVDDDGSVLRALCRFLTKHYIVETAPNAEAAAIRLATEEFEAIITDFDMPVYNGIWLLAQVAMNYPEMNRVMMSADDPALFAPHIQSGLIQHYHIKPFSIEGIFESLGN